MPVTITFVNSFKIALVAQTTKKLPESKFFCMIKAASTKQIRAGYIQINQSSVLMTSL